MKKWLCALLCFQLLTLNVAFSAEDDIIKNTQNDIILVGAAGAGGAVLGLSTLSFYEQPSDHIANIWTGAALGIIAGVIFVAYNSASRNSDDLTTYKSSEEFSTKERAGWHAQESKLLTMQSVQFGAEFWNLSF